MGTPIFNQPSPVESQRMIITQQQSEQVVPVIVKTNYGPVRMTETPEKKFVLNL
jgi:hypothetical protein